MDYIDNLKSPLGKRGVFSILLAVIVVSIFVMFFFYSHTVPTIDNIINKSIDSGIESTTIKLNNVFADYQKTNTIVDAVIPEVYDCVFSKEISGILKTLSNREQKLVKRANTYTKVVGFIIIAIMCIALYFVYKSIRNDIGIHGDVGISSYISTAIIILIILSSFQILFYKYASLYKYPGSLGKEELIDIAINNISPQCD